MKPIHYEELVEDGRVHGSVYTDDSVFQAEVDAIFGTTWLFVAHESELPEKGAYKTTLLGDQPVIVTRSADDDSFNVLLNRCRHRGAQVCENASGYANFFRCRYHGWTYSNTGTLTGVPFRNGYGEDFKTEELGLLRAPRVDSMHGFIFASLAAEGESLESFLGNAAPYLETISQLGTEGIELSGGVHKHVYDGNWKLQLENSIDPYHFGFVHESFLEITGKKKDWTKDVREGKTRKTLDLGNGHSVSTTDADRLGIGKGTQPFSLIIFPNIAFIGIQMRVVRPISPLRTEVLIYPMMLRGADAATNAARLRSHEHFYGPAGFGYPDDLEIAFHRVHQGLRAKQAGYDWVLINRGLDRELELENGIRQGGPTDEVPQRAFYRQWRSSLAKAKSR